MIHIILRLYGEKQVFKKTASRYSLLMFSQRIKRAAKLVFIVLLQNHGLHEAVLTEY